MTLPGQTIIPRKRRRGFESATDMLRSMGVLALMVGMVLLLTWRPHNQAAVKPVDLPAIAKGAESVAGFALVIPNLPQTWIATSARISPAVDDVTKHVWHIGYVTPAEQYLAVEQSDTALAQKFLSSWTKDLKPSPAVKIGALSWVAYRDAAGVAHTYVAVLATTQLVITGSASEAELMTAVEAAGPMIG